MASSNEQVFEVRGLAEVRQAATQVVAISSPTPTRGLPLTPTGATPIVNGLAVDEDALLEDGDEVAFNKPAGQKG